MSIWSKGCRRAIRLCGGSGFLNGNILAADMGTARQEQRATLNTEALRTRGSAVLFSRGKQKQLALFN
jgi:hypothetical protein